MISPGRDSRRSVEGRRQREEGHPGGGHPVVPEVRWDFIGLAQRPRLSSGPFPVRNKASEIRAFCEFELRSGGPSCDESFVNKGGTQ